jgi:hypothetical protein
MCLTRRQLTSSGRERTSRQRMCAAEKRWMRRQEGRNFTRTGEMGKQRRCQQEEAGMRERVGGKESQGKEREREFGEDSGPLGIHGVRSSTIVCVEEEQHRQGGLRSAARRALGGSKSCDLAHRPGRATAAARAASFTGPAALRTTTEPVTATSLCT